MYLNIMEDLNKHLIMRQGLMQQIVYPRFARHIGIFLARTLFYTSDLYLTSAEKKEMVPRFINPVLCKVTEDLVFTEPYMDHPNNRWNRLLDPQVEAIRSNDALRAEMLLLKEKFMTRAQALIHGDLHTGSIMINEEETRVIDPEFGFFGPMGFDIGAVLGNLMLAYASQEYHAGDEQKRAEYRQWLLDTTRDSWIVFEQEFRRLWDEEVNDYWPSPTFRENYVRQLLRDTAGFGAAKMMRRILGLAHVPDLEEIPDQHSKAIAESLALNIAQSWVMNRRSVTSIDDLIKMAKEAQPSYPFG
jgi:5-methylthioribose kinase